jgi:hypothetical protein
MKQSEKVWDKQCDGDETPGASSTRVHLGVGFPWDVSVYLTVPTLSRFGDGRYCLRCDEDVSV